MMLGRKRFGQKQKSFVLCSAIAGACIAYGVFAMNSLAFAEEGATVSNAQSPSQVNDQASTQASAQSNENSDDQTAVKKAVKKAKGGKGTREKDADGTEAPHQFKANTVIKSQYKLNGEPLEVDPD